MSVSLEIISARFFLDRVLKRAAERISQNTIEGSNHRQEGKENENDAKNFIENSRSAFDAEMLFSPLDPSEIIDQPFGLDHEQQADTDDR